ncbi:MAG: carboxypeptidase-like regulatory domain-containing protein, partial [Saprospiraceae bacterium]
MKKVATLLCLLCASSLLWAQSLNVSGQVKDEAGEPLPGVTVIVKNTIKGAVTGNDGRYFVEVPGGDAVLIFSYTGFARMEVPVNNQRELDVTMTESGSALGEVVVVGFGTSYRQDLTGSISKLSAKEFELQPVQSFENAIQGRAAGV